jgi:osmotically-inducible protein OsmY
VSVPKLLVLIASVLLGAAAVGGCASTPPAPPQNRVSDQLLAERVYAALGADPTYFYRHVNVHADAGVVTLSGYVWSQPAIIRAREIALKTPGVSQVVTGGLELERNGRDANPAR